MKALAAIAVTALCGYFAVATAKTTSKSEAQGQLLSIQSKEALAFVVFDRGDIENMRDGQSMIVHTQGKKKLRGKLVSKEPWFHRTIAKIKLEKPRQ